MSGSTRPGTAAHAVATAEQVRLDGDIYRRSDGYVSIQQKAPYTGDNDRFQTWYVDHCGISVAYVLEKSGLRFGIDYPDTMQYSPWLANDLLNGGYAVSRPEPGDIGVIDWGGAGWGAISRSDHIVFFADTSEFDSGFVTCWETNTTPDGRPYYYRRATSLFVAWGRPKYRTPQEPDVSTHVTVTTAVLASLQQQEDTMPLILDLIDADGTVVGHRGYLPGLGWHTPVDGTLTEDNGWTRARMSAAEFDRAGLVALQNSATMTEQVARQVKAIMEAS